MEIRELRGDFGHAGVVLKPVDDVLWVLIDTRTSPEHVERALRVARALAGQGDSQDAVDEAGGETAPLLLVGSTLRQRWARGRAAIIGVAAAGLAVGLLLPLASGRPIPAPQAGLVGDATVTASGSAPVTAVLPTSAAPSDTGTPSRTSPADDEAAAGPATPPPAPPPVLRPVAVAVIPGTSTVEPTTLAASTTPTTEAPPIDLGAAQGPTRRRPCRLVCHVVSGPLGR